MYAIVQLGNHQYKAAVGKKITIEKLDGDVGSQVKFKDVLFVSDGSDVKIGNQVKSIVTGKIVSQEKGDKIAVFKKKRRHVYKKKTGHRAMYTIVEITGIEG